MQSQSDTTDGATSELRSDAKQLGSTAVNRVHSEIDARKGTAATQAKSVSSAIDRAAGELDDSAPQWLQSAFRQGAEQVQRFADTIEQKDSRQLVDEISNFARNSPGTFLAGCAAAGFAAARIFKAGADSGTSSGNDFPKSNRFEDGSSDQAAFGSSGTGAGFTPASPRGEFV
ncbi:MAG: hypothetical protein M3Q52_05520 [Pseudomonadota bacterium]|nr:hypothetical protein [Pseudomonadota bacterium]